MALTNNGVKALNFHNHRVVEVLRQQRLVRPKGHGWIELYETYICDVQVRSYTLRRRTLRCRMDYDRMLPKNGLSLRR